MGVRLMPPFHLGGRKLPHRSSCLFVLIWSEWWRSRRRTRTPFALVQFEPVHGELANLDPVVSASTLAPFVNYVLDSPRNSLAGTSAIPGPVPMVGKVNPTRRRHHAARRPSGRLVPVLYKTSSNCYPLHRTKPCTALSRMGGTPGSGGGCPDQDWCREL